jgi:23S rRNA pseudouridine1911/1915/1917 synthase
MGFPILGDPQYGSEESQSISREMGFEHQLLLAYSLDFVHPITEEQLRITTKLPIAKAPMD